jgi:hypothetical protein
VSDQLGHVEVATNGNRSATEPSEHSHGMTSLATDGVSTEERLSQLMETIQSWDWRTAPAKADESSLSEATTTASALTTPAPPEVRVDPVEVPPDSADLHLHPVDVRQETVDVYPNPTVVPVDSVDARQEPVDVDPYPTVPRRARVEVPPEPAPMPEAAQPLISLPTSLHAAPETPLVAPEQPTLVPMTFVGPEEPDASEMRKAGAPSGLAPEFEPTAEENPIRRLWSHRWTKAVILCVVAVAAVLLIIWTIRLAHNGPNTGGSSAPATQPASGHGAATASHSSFVSPITPAQLARYKLYANRLQPANVAASKAIVSAGSAPTTAQLAAAVTAYHSAVNLYDFQLRFIQWPASMQAAIADDHAQLEALVSFLATFSTTSPTNMSGWLSGLHIRTGAAQTTDNLVRRDLGLPNTNSFP